ncbi:hypothetical protein C1H46_007908 [Malus baccata]|uniref:AP complex mu/sigma subunit domain-containing protein n=1 Tax=Malus baccata TaxID=106549 RepID=A0A540N5W6_MALBA|nr:hypothetical protein C1H46_007908 [Malus baccata]
MLQCIFLLSDSGEVMLEKQLTGQRVDRSICTWFWEHTISQGDSPKLQSVIASPTHYLFQVLREGITFLACTQVEMPPLMGIEFLCRVADVLTDYLGSLNEDVIKDNFVIVYELLDEMIDNGFPLTTEPNILRETSSSFCWRSLSRTFSHRIRGYDPPPLLFGLPISTVQSLLGLSFHHSQPPQNDATKVKTFAP